jgi:uncharacterized protein Yka (UPF0111/DUF47 family)
VGKNFKLIIDDIREVLQTSSSDLTLPPGKENEPIERALKELSRVEKWADEVTDQHMDMCFGHKNIAELTESISENAEKEEFNELLDEIKNIADTHSGYWRSEN